MIAPGDSGPACRWPEPPLGDAAIAMRPWRLGDAGALLAAWADPDIAAMGTVPTNPTVELAYRWIAGSEQRCRDGIAIDLVITPVDHSDVVIGEVGVVLSGDPPNQGEIGYWISARHRRQGAATGAVKLFSDWLVDPDGGGLRRLAAQVQPKNSWSIVVIERAGFHFVHQIDDQVALYTRKQSENSGQR